jgi:hypothetical protein
MFIEKDDWPWIWAKRHYTVEVMALVKISSQSRPRRKPVSWIARGFLCERKKMHKTYIRIGIVLIMGAFVLGACGPSTPKDTPTPTEMSVAEISTAAVQTFVVQLTQSAPTITPTPSLTNTPLTTRTFTPTRATATQAVPTSSSCANYSFVSDVTIPDGTQMPVNTAFTKTWRVKNTGTCEWSTNFKLVFSFGDAMGGQTVSLPNPVATGATADISVNLTVPNKSGKLTGAWTLVDDKGQHFGAILTVVINVGSVTPTKTGSAAPTETAGAVSTATPTETPTLTPAPTSG